MVIDNSKWSLIATDKTHSTYRDAGGNELVIPLDQDDKIYFAYDLTRDNREL